MPIYMAHTFGVLFYTILSWILYSIYFLIPPLYLLSDCGFAASVFGDVYRQVSLDLTRVLSTDMLHLFMG